MSDERDILFKCPGCGRHLSASFSYVGKTFLCPRCGSPVAVPLRSERFRFRCTCGFKLYSKLSLVGAHFRCPSCHRLLGVPSPRAVAGGGELPVARPVRIEPVKPPRPADSESLEVEAEVEQGEAPLRADAPPDEASPGADGGEGPPRRDKGGP